jgi:hypothetical protein
MSLDDVLFGVIVSGVGLSVAYFRDEYIGWREHKAAEMRKQTSRRELHIDKSEHREDADLIRSVVTLEPIADTERAEVTKVAYRSSAIDDLTWG